MSPITERVLLGSGLLAAGLVASLLTVTVPELVESLVYSGVNVPAFASLFASHVQVAWLLPAAVLGIWFAWPKGKSRNVAIWTVGSLGCLAIGLFVAIVAFPQYFQFAVTI